jgi:Polysaccharide pyruvyl transferase
MAPRRTAHWFVNGVRTRLRRHLTWSGIRNSAFSKYNSRPFSRTPITLLDPPQTASTPRLVHIAQFHPNAGDAFLPVALRDLFCEQLGPMHWRGRHVAKVVDDRSMSQLNEADGIVIGGGGLFLSDTNPNSLSGWQWSCSVEALDRLTTPIALFAVGYNRFRGQPEFSPVFTDHLTLLADRATFLGMRNTGSVEATRGYLPTDLHPKVRLQPCMTTLASRIYPNLMSAPSRAPKPFIALNCAFDRSELRFGDDEDRILDDIVGAMQEVSSDVAVKYFSHHPEDEKPLPLLTERGIDVELVRLHDVPGEEILRNYSEALVVIGMRGHAQLIPYGCGRPIVSLVSHDKMFFFLDDIDARAWGVEIKSPDLRERLVAAVRAHLDDLPAAEATVARGQERLWEITNHNLTELGAAWELPNPSRATSTLVAAAS